ncbi:MAG: ATP phosphoribosyltransferase regulatory subunit [Butyribacter sp.]|nr:ATP phosphoribosyltransferase regulatory subunit [bacterium]MDY3855337.1 ATP phosphoribosyltransferase regulatory subunit [Butyribacter sp.]
MSQGNFDLGDTQKGQELLHTPGGVRDVYGIECARKLTVKEKVHNVMKKYGFRDIETPTFEYFDIFSKERGTVQSKEMFKFFDRDNNTLVLRPDVTPSIARCVAKYDRDEEMQIRLCYTGKTFVNTSQYKGKLQEVTQVGAELYNDDTSDADAEMIAMMVECLLESGLKEFQLEVGHADFFRGLVEEAGFEKQEAEELRNLIVSKNFFGVEEMLDHLTVSEPLKEIFVKLPELLGDLPECISYIEKRTKNERVLQALERLEKVESILALYGVSDYITIDLSMLSQYSYYTGVIFRAYTYGNGEALATGGRYDGLVKQFGKDAPAIGLAIVIDQLMLALSRQNLFEDTTLGGTIFLYPQSLRKEAVRLTEEYRKEGKNIQMLRKSSQKSFDVYKEYAQRMKIDTILYLEKENVILAYDVATKQEEYRQL